MKGRIVRCPLGAEKSSLPPFPLQRGRLPLQLWGGGPVRGGVWGGWGDWAASSRGKQLLSYPTHRAGEHAVSSPSSLPPFFPPSFHY